MCGLVLGGCWIQQFTVSLSPSDLLLAYAVKPRLVTIQSGHSQLPNLRQLVYDRSAKTRLSLWMPVGTAGEHTAGVQSPVKRHAFGYLRSVTGNMDCGLWVDDTKQTPLDLSIAKARILWRIFEVK